MFPYRGATPTRRTAELLLRAKTVNWKPPVRTNGHGKCKHPGPRCTNGHGKCKHPGPCRIDDRGRRVCLYLVSEPLPLVRPEGQHGTFRAPGVPDGDRPAGGCDLDAVAAGAAAVARLAP